VLGPAERHRSEREREEEKGGRGGRFTYHRLFPSLLRRGRGKRGRREKSNAFIARRNKKRREGINLNNNNLLVLK